MEANKRTLGEILSPDVRLVAPLFQRPYVWNEERNWEPLWQALEEVFTRQLTASQQRPYFLGALVLDQLLTAVGTVPAREVIDGQQRLTTLLILFKAGADLFAEHDLKHEARQLLKLALNDLEEETDQRFKLWPTNIDREAFRAVMTGSKTDGKIGSAYAFFRQRLAKWLGADPEQHKTRAAAVVTGVKQGLVFVAIDLGNDDDGQLIFETLNALGTPLLPSDLVKNLLFRQAAADQLNTDALYNKYWRSFEDRADYWREEVGVGRLFRPRLDVFLQHYLTVKLAKEVPIPHLFRSYREHYLENGLGSVEEALQDFARYAHVYREFDRGGSTPATRSLRRMLMVMDMSTVLPVVLGILTQAPPEEAEGMCLVLGSYLVRRMICALTTKNLNRLTVELIDHLGKKGWTRKNLRDNLLAQQAHTLRWPDDEMIHGFVTTKSAYNVIRSSRIAYLLCRVEERLRTAKSEYGSAEAPWDKPLTIEHLMPQKWETHWVLPAGATEEEIQRRRSMVDQYGNLTILTQRLNSDVSNGPWETKRTKLNQHTVLLMNSHIAAGEAWNESCIAKRSAELAAAFCAIWPR